MFPVTTFSVQSAFSAILMSGLLFQVKTPKPLPRTFDVCSLMADLRQHRHALITLRGALSAGDELIVINDLECKRPFVAADIVWPASVAIVSSNANINSSDSPAPFVTSKQARERLAEAVMIQKASKGRQKVMIQVTGFLRVRQKYVSALAGSRRGGNGYGHFGMNPAELVLRSVDEVVLKVGN